MSTVPSHVGVERKDALGERSGAKPVEEELVKCTLDMDASLSAALLAAAALAMAMLHKPTAVAAPLFSAVMTGALRLLNVAPDDYDVMVAAAPRAAGAAQ